jgi:hypothetical protein
VFYGEPIQDKGDRVDPFPFSEQRTLTHWQFKPWQDPVKEGSTYLDTPDSWERTFDKPDLLEPLFLATQGLSKGHAYGNGEALGEYWEIDPQHSLYLPEPWMRDQNRLAVFDKEGKPPDQVYVFGDARCRIRKVLVCARQYRRILDRGRRIALVKTIVTLGLRTPHRFVRGH